MPKPDFFVSILNSESIIPTTMSSTIHCLQDCQLTDNKVQCNKHRLHYSNQPINTRRISKAFDQKWNKSFSSSISKTSVAAVTSIYVGVGPIEELQHAKQLYMRNRNEEAIQDLRVRIPEIDKIFDVYGRIGNGTFSTVLLGTLKKERHLPDIMRRKFAIKHHVPTSHPDRIMKELQCMTKIGGTDNVVGINCCIRCNESVAFIMPYMPHDRFHDFFDKMDFAEAQNYIKNLLIALKRVHKFDIIHRDVKPSNFLYNRRKRQFLLVDFGLAQQMPYVYGSPFSAIQEATVRKNLVLQLPHKHGKNDGKRQRDFQNEKPSALIDFLSNTNKRTRYQELTNESSFKMPLKLMNEITATGKLLANHLNNLNNTVFEIEISGDKIKSNTIDKNHNSRSSQEINRSLEVRNFNAMKMSVNVCNKSSLVTSITGTVCNNGSFDMSSIKTNTNRQITHSNTNKCFCYGHPQVCNICLIKKEVYASRAGTPGYRPPEVLLKYPEQTTAVDMWAVGVILLSILSSVYPFFKAPNDYVALAEIVTIFGDKIIRKTAFLLERLATLSQRTRPLDLRKLCVRFRNRAKFSSTELLKKYQRPDGSCEVCKNCDQFYFNCLCRESNYNTEPLEDVDTFPSSVYDLLNKLLEVNPHKRISAEEALKHPFFTEESSNGAN